MTRLDEGMRADPVLFVSLLTSMDLGWTGRSRGGSLILVDLGPRIRGAVDERGTEALFLARGVF